MLKTLSLALLLGFNGSAYALDVAPDAPQTLVSDGDPTVYYAHTTLTGNYEMAQGFTQKNLASAATTFSFTVSGISSAKPYISVYAIGSGSTYVEVVAPFNPAAGSVSVTFSLANLCPGTSVSGCDQANRLDMVTNPIPGAAIRFVESATASVATADKDAGELVRIKPAIVGAELVSCPSGLGFFPGDSSILVNTSELVGKVNTTFGSSAIFNSVQIAANATAVPSPRSGSTIIKTVGYLSGEQEVTGFDNSDDTTQHFYGADYGIVDSAGIAAYCGRLSYSGYPLTNVFATDIQGFLRESNCFVATASYRDGRAPGVMLLRHFRDEVLSQFDAGRSFIRWYYMKGPIAAEWLLKNPVFRSVALMALIPLQVFAWIALHPGILALPMFLLLGILGLVLRDRKRMKVSKLGVAMLALTMIFTGTPRSAHSAEASKQPYIDSLISELPQESYNGTGSYTQSLKKNLQNDPDAEGKDYTKELKKQIPARDGSENYSQQLSQGIPKETGSAIQDYKNGKKLKANKGDMNTRSAFGFKLFASSTRTYTAGANQDIAYETVYGSGWVPDFAIHYEWRPFTSSLLKKFGLYTSAGASFTKAKGKLNYQGPFGADARTDFKFITLPVNLGLIYRMNFGDIIYPFFAGGPSAIGFIEQRNDNQSGHKGYTPGYWFTAGVAFGMDWMSPERSWDQYESIGAKHNYFTLDYTRLESVGGGLVEFTVDGIEAGFTFEI